MRKTKTKRNLIISVTALSVLIIAAVGVWYATRPKPKTSTTRSVTKQEAEDANKLQKPTDTKNASGDSTTTAVTNTSAASSADNIYVVISRPFTTAEHPATVSKSGTLEFRSTITGASSGSCTLKLTGPSAQTMSKTATLVYQNNYTSCSIDVPGSQLATGDWTLSLTVTSGSTTTKPATTKVTVQ